MNKVLLVFRGKVLGAAMLLAALVPFPTVQSQETYEDGLVFNCIIGFDLLSKNAPGHQQPYANGFLQTLIPNFSYHLQDAEAFVNELGLYEAIAAQIPYMEQERMLWVYVMDCTRALYQRGWIRPKP